MSTVHVLVPAGIDDPGRPSGGNVYDRRLCGGLAQLGWGVREHRVPGGWPCPDAAARDALAGVLREVPDGATLLADGLVASAARELVPVAGRLRLVVLVHLPLAADPDRSGDPAVAKLEGEVLAAADAVLTTSGWTRRWLLDRYALAPSAVHVAEPGVDTAPLSPGTGSGGELLCVAAVSPTKGHDVLVEALAAVADLPWTCTCVGSLDVAPDLVEGVRRRAAEAGVEGRLRLVGARTGPELEGAWAAADLLVLASRAETFGMVVAEALAHGLPVVGSDVGGLPTTLGRAPGGDRPGLLVPPGDPVALAGSLRHWLTDAPLRARLREAARARRDSLHGWAATTAAAARVLEGIAGSRSG